MTSRSDGSAARRYHQGTKHPHGQLMDRRHRYDPARNPLPFKIYRDLDPAPLPVPAGTLEVPAFAAISDLTEQIESKSDVEAITRILQFSAGVTKTLRFPWGEIPFRAAACTGALYHIELYVVCGELDGLSAGVYHFDPRGPALTRLRSGDYRAVLIDAAAGESHLSSAPAVIVYTDVFWRNAVKYQAREYRHAFWDSGTIIANTLATTSALGLPASVVSGFVDGTVNRLLDLDTYREVSLAMVPIGRVSDPNVGPAPEVEELGLQTVPVSDFEIDFPAIREIHHASSLATPDDVLAWRNSSAVLPPWHGSPVQTPLDRPEPSELPTDGIETVIRRRGSTRRFRPDPVEFAQISAVLANATGGFRNDYSVDRLIETYLIVNSVTGLESGTYVFEPGSQSLQLLKSGDFRHQAGQLGLGQALAADAAVNVYFMSDLDRVLGVYGDRGYRIAQLEASVTAGRMYLAAYALRLGATGLTFFDDAVTDLFSPHAAGKSAMFLIAIGRPLRSA